MAAEQENPALLGRVPGGVRSGAARVLYSGAHRDPQTQRCYQEEDESNYGVQVQNEFSQRLPFYLITLCQKESKAKLANMFGKDNF